VALILARLLAQLDLRRPPEERLDAGAPLPATLSPFRLRFGVGG